MFRRDARNKLRNMGGIMASSEPLIQAVASYQFGGGVNTMTQPTNQIPVAIGGGPRVPDNFSLGMGGSNIFSNMIPKGNLYENYIPESVRPMLTNIGNYVKENPAEVAGFIGLSIVPGGLLFKGVKYTPKMFGALKNILFGSKVQYEY